MIFEQNIKVLFNQLDDHGKMVLSTSLNDQVTSRMMSVIIQNRQFYFQTDITFRKCEQLQYNSNVALCTDNIQIEGICEQIGKPIDYDFFCRLFRQYFSGSYDRYTNLENERLFLVKPCFIQKWIYENGEPFIETFDFKTSKYTKKAYCAQ